MKIVLLFLITFFNVQAKEELAHKYLFSNELQISSDVFILDDE